MTVTWVDGVTPLNAANMGTLEQTPRKGVANGYASLDATGKVPAAQLPPIDITTKVDKDSVVVAATRIVANKLLAGDAQPAFRIMGDGKLEWGAGGATAPDTNLRRSAAGWLHTDSFFNVQGVFTVSYGRVTVRAGEQSQIFLGDRSGDAVTPYIAFGSAGDTNLYRAAAGQLATDGNIRVTGQVLLGAAGDAPLLRYGGNRVGTVGSFVADGAVGGWGFEAHGTGDTYMRSILRNDGVLAFGPGNAPVDTYLSRFTTNVLHANHRFWVGGSTIPGSGDLWVFASGDGWPRISLTNNSYIAFGPGTAGTDTYLYRSGVSALRCDNSFYTKYSVIVDHGGVGGKLYFGPSLDAHIGRPGANTLETYSTFNVMKDTGVGSYSGLGVFFSGIGARAVVAGAPDSGTGGYRQLWIEN